MALCGVGASMFGFECLGLSGLLSSYLPAGCGFGCDGVCSALEMAAPQGAIDYAECFQCLDCVTDYQDAQRCLPLIRERKGRDTLPGKVIPIQPVNTYA